jgi:small subunit ribosomal protein S20
MANIKQQKKRIGIAQRQRFENLQYRSTIKTLFRRLQDHVNAGSKDEAAAAHRELVRMLDRAAARNVLHANNAARKKARAARILVSEPEKSAKVVRKPRKKAAPQRKAKVQKPDAEATAAAKAAAEAAATEAAAEETVEAATEAAAEAVAAEETVEAATEESAVVEEAPTEDAAAEGDEPAAGDSGKS